jgi:hypothetical protein
MATRVGLGKCGGVVDMVREDRVVILRRSVVVLEANIYAAILYSRRVFAFSCVPRRRALALVVETRGNLRGRVIN